MAKIAIFCKASFSHGMGHLVRQSHIAKILRNRGNEIIFSPPITHPPNSGWINADSLTKP
jgi:spore coat polysaccharide biosynthesis predicted glycosyltransferase SpsG